MYCIADGYAFSTKKRGVLGPGAEISESDFASRESFLKAVTQNKIKEVSEKQDDKKTALTEASAKQAAARAALDTANDARSAALQKLEAAVREKQERRTANTELNDAYEALVKAEDAITHASKKGKAEAESKAAAAKTQFEALEDADEAYTAAKNAAVYAKEELNKTSVCFDAANNPAAKPEKK